MGEVDDAHKILADFVRETGCDEAARIADLPPRGFGTDYDTLPLDWQGMVLTVRSCVDWCRSYREVYGYALAHVTVSSPNSAPLPISETGHSSMFVSAVILDEWDGPLPYIRFLLDEGAKRPAWVACHARRQQLTLF